MCWWDQLYGENREKSRVSTIRRLRKGSQTLLFHWILAVISHYYSWTTYQTFRVCSGPKLACCGHLQKAKLEKPCRRASCYQKFPFSEVTERAGRFRHFSTITLDHLNFSRVQVWVFCQSLFQSDLWKSSTSVLPWVWFSHFWERYFWTWNFSFGS